MKRNIWDVGADVIVIPVNCVGVMGAGLAKQCRLKHPAVYKHYKQLCEDKTLSYGGLAIIREGSTLFAMVPTKDHWRDKSVMFDVMSAFAKLVVHLVERLEADEGISLTVAVPMLGAGLGGLDESLVRENLTEMCALAEAKQPRLKFVLC